MRILKIPFCDIAFYEKTRLSGEMEVGTISAGSSSIKVRNPAGISVGDLLVIEAFESEDAEIVKVRNIDRETKVVDLNGQTYLDHSIGVVIIRAPYDKVKIYKGSTDDISQHTEMGGSPVNLRPDNAYTVFVDNAGGISDFYSYKYVNSIASAGGNTTLSAEYSSGLSLSVVSIAGFTVGDDIVIVNTDGSKEAHRKIASLSSGTIVMDSALSDGYPVGAIVREAVVGEQTLYRDSDYDSILTVKSLKEHFMFGLDLTDDDGYPFPNSMFEFAIRAAVDSLEKTLQVMLKPTEMFEYHDFFAQDYRDFAFIQLNHWPVINVTKIQVKYPTAVTPIEFPLEWVQLRKERGNFHLVPTAGSISTILMGRGGDYLTFVWRGFDFMPNLWHIWYTAGFEKGKVPNDVVGIVGKMACFYPLNIAGDLVGGIAIASKSIGIDGLSQSINTTSSAENAGYSARLRQYERELRIEVPRLQQYYKAFRMAVM